jgi:hypothetical protein
MRPSRELSMEAAVSPAATPLDAFALSCSLHPFTAGAKMADTKSNEAATSEPEVRRFQELTGSPE